MRKKFCIVCLCLYHLAATAAVHVFGDSHSWMFRGYPGAYVHHVGPITMHRVGRDHTKCIRFSDYGIGPEDTVVMVFGEIDVRCHTKKVAKRLDCTVETVLNDLAERYLHALIKIQEATPVQKLIVCSVVPPTLAPGFKVYRKGLPLEARGEFPMIGSHRERLIYNRILNQILKEKCREEGIDFLNIQPIISDKNGFLKPSFSDGGIHVKQKKYGYIHRALSDLLTDVCA